MEKFIHRLNEYKENMSSQQELDHALLNTTDKAQWIANMKSRAHLLHEMYEKNHSLLSEVETFLTKPLNAENAAALYDEVHSMYWNNYDDCQVILPILYRLVEYYETHHDVDKLIFLYSATFYEESEIQNRRIGSTETTANYNLKIIQYGSEYNQLEYEKTRARIWAAYYNLIVVGLGNKVIDVDTSYYYLKQALELWNSPIVQSLDGDNESMIHIVERISKEWLVAEEFIHHSSPETQAAFCKEAELAYEKENANASQDINSEVYAAYLHAQLLQDKMSADDMVNAYATYCSEKIDSCLNADELSDEDSYFLINAPLTLLRWLDYEVSKGTYDKVLNTISEMTKDSWYHKLTQYSVPFINEIMAQWCVQIISHMDTSKDKEDIVFRVLIRRQLPTFLHSVMVSYLAEALYEQAIYEKPELFANVPDSVKNKLDKYVRHCALLHDIGKTKITDIVNTQIRSLSDKEFQGIRQHPRYGAEMIAGDESLSKYHDVILGHHKFYDGTAGYPMDFNNTTSDYQIIIDLITICDCIDAASDNLGRNYKSAKTFDQVLNELEAEKGTRYNPDLVDIIRNSAHLQRKMRYIINEGRLELMYHAYSENNL